MRRITAGSYSPAHHPRSDNANPRRSASSLDAKDAANAEVLPSLYRAGRICRGSSTFQSGAITNGTRSKGCVGRRLRALALTQHSCGSRVSWAGSMAPRFCLGFSRGRLYLSRRSIDSSRSKPEPACVRLPAPASSAPYRCRWHANLRVHIRAKSPTFLTHVRQPLRTVLSPSFQWFLPATFCLPEFFSIIRKREVR